MSEKTMSWRLGEDSRYRRSEFIGPQDFYFTVEQGKFLQKPIGKTSLRFTHNGDGYLQPEREAELLRALQEALEVAREWAQPAAPPAPAEVSHE